jgi:hypothetical protein
MAALVAYNRNVRAKLMNFFPTRGRKNRKREKTVNGGEERTAEGVNDFSSSMRSVDKFLDDPAEEWRVR